jgi:regulator of protease activity HflC (stomatin/prohibitin superfamily)
MEAFLAAIALVVIGYTANSVRIVNEGTEVLVERLGRFHRKLPPGLNFIVPMLDNVVLEESTRERVLDIAPQDAITQDEASLEVDAVVYWRVLDLERTYYEVEDIEEALKNLVITTLRSKIGQMEFSQTFSSRDDINQALLRELDKVTETWGVKVTRVEVQRITPSKAIMEAMDLERAAESKRKAAIAEAEGKREAAIAEARGTVESLQMISEALQAKSNTQQILKYLVAQRYVDANLRLSESTNSKIIFMDPKALTEATSELMVGEAHPHIPEDLGNSGNGGNGA